jgi:hypothetical protein
MDAREIHDGLVPEIQEMLAFVAVGYPIHELGDELERLSDYFQGLGIAYLLEGADQERFLENLARSGHARRYFLRKSREGNNDDDRHLALSRTEAFFDALAGGQTILAREIIELSIGEWHADWEYEDDFCYYLFLHRIVQAGSENAAAELRGLLARFERVLEGSDSPRLDVCRALLDRNSDGVREALSLLMGYRSEEMDEARERNLEADASACVCWARSYVSCEGLALLRVAEMQGLAPLESGEELEMCPALAMLPATDPNYLDMFAAIEAELARGR